MSTTRQFEDSRGEHNIATQSLINDIVNIFTLSPNAMAELYLVRLNQVSNTRKAMIGLFDALIEDAAEALFTRWMIEHREELLARMETLPAIGPRKADLATSKRKSA